MSSGTPGRQPLLLEHVGPGEPGRADAHQGAP